MFEGLFFNVDAISLFFMWFSGLVGLIILIYSFEYMKKSKNLFEFYFFVVLFIFSMFGLVASNHLIIMYVFWEMAALCSWKLIGFNRGGPDIKAANKAFLITVGSSSAMLIGFILVYIEKGTFYINLLRGTEVSGIALVLIFIGIMGKSCIFPLHTWLPDAGVAPTPVTALLHAAVLVKIGVYAFLRLFCQTFVSPGWVLGFTGILAAVSAIIAGLSALKETDIKRVLAKSTISQLGFIICALSINSETSIKGAVIFILAHALGKAGLFLTAGIIQEKTGTRDITKMGGLIRKDPLLAVIFAFCALSVAGMPPFLGFWGKFLIIISTAEAGSFVTGILLFSSAIITIFYLLRLFNAIFLGNEQAQVQAQERRMPVMTASVLMLALCSIVFGLMVGTVSELVQTIVQQIL